MMLTVTHMNTHLHKHLFTTVDGREHHQYTISAAKRKSAEVSIDGSLPAAAQQPTLQASWSTVSSNSALPRSPRGSPRRLQALPSPRRRSLAKTTPVVTPPPSPSHAVRNVSEGNRSIKTDKSVATTIDSNTADAGLRLRMALLYCLRFLKMQARNAVSGTSADDRSRALLLTDQDSHDRSDYDDEQPTPTTAATTTIHDGQQPPTHAQHGEQLRLRGIQPSRRTNEIHIHIPAYMDTSVKHVIAACC